MPTTPGVQEDTQGGPRAGGRLPQLALCTGSGIDDSDIR
jgi:hypothetical protein